MKIFQGLFFLAFLFLVSIQLTANGEISANPFNGILKVKFSGVIIDAKTKLPIQGVSVYILDIKSGALTNADGYFEINNLSGGTHLVEISHIGYSTIVDNINLDSDLKFDLITSWVSCGFHYPANTYKELIEKHSTSDTKIILDIRKNKQQIVGSEQGIEIVNILNERQKYVTAEVKFLKN